MLSLMSHAPESRYSAAGDIPQTGCGYSASLIQKEAARKGRLQS